MYLELAKLFAGARNGTLDMACIGRGVWRAPRRRGRVHFGGLQFSFGAKGLLWGARRALARLRGCAVRIQGTEAAVVPILAGENGRKRRILRITAKVLLG
jgi:hypothetical protein